jgi:hypothetical protein
MIRWILTAALIAATAGAAPAGGDLLARMAALNPNLHSFKATMHANVALKTFPFLSTQLLGTYYFKEPDKNKVVFTSGVPMMAAQFDKLYARIEPPARWTAIYDVRLVSDDGKAAVFKLVPRKHGNVDSVTARVDDASATVRSMRWNYGNGGYAEMQNTYGSVQGNTVVTSQTGHVEEPGYTADITSTIDDYTINLPVADSVFE